VRHDTPLAVTAPLVGCTSAESVTILQRSPEWGYEQVWASEVDGPNAFTLLGALAVTTDLDLGVGVVPVQTRTVFALGMSAVSLAQLTDGRFILGIGASSEVLVGRFGGQPFDRPLSYLREAALALKPLLQGDRSGFEGRYVRIGGYKPPTPPPKPVPLYLGSLNPRSLRLAGVLADGLCVNHVSTRHLPIMLDEVRQGAREVGRELGQFPVVARLFCLLTDDLPGGRSLVAHAFSPYAATTVYNRFYRWMGYPKEADAIAKAAKAKDRDGMVAAFSDRITDDLFLIGTATAIVDRLHEFVDAGVTVPVIAPIAFGPNEAARTLTEIGRRWTR
jgi:probable F420-dependent oxidoreductase